MVAQQRSNPAFDAARALGGPLAGQLRFYKDFIGDRLPEIAAAYQSLIERMQQAGLGSAAPKVGERLPPFVLPDLDGALVSSEELLADGHLVISFNRGSWCTFCWLELAAFGDIAETVKPLGATIISITPEIEAYNREIKQRLKLPFSFLTDIDNGYGLQLGLTMPISNEIRTLLEPRGIDLTTYQGNSSWFVPVPATYVVDRTGIIRASYVNPDYRCRFDTTLLPEILAELN